ncbi:MAG TPA: toll/interleukin-1 receptor domain-containing protein [Burkholderiaceae bacterium]|nr:toll/interleukin-1 receptor domain-containing protein [Burkholderiaceae bacterium]
MIANKLHVAVSPAADTWNADVFMDTHEIEPGGLFDAAIIAALKRTTHFIILLNSSYWASEYCRKELALAVERFEKGLDIALLFVMVDKLDPKHFAFDKDRRAGRIKTEPLLKNVGMVSFLGPFDPYNGLVRMQYENEATLSDQIADLVRRLDEIMPT